MSDPNWSGLLGDAKEPTPLVAREERGPVSQTFSRPYYYLASDQAEYVVKLRRPEHRRAIASDQVVGRLAPLIGAPVPTVEAIEVEAGYLPANEDVSAAGVGHASRRVVRHRDGSPTDIPANCGRLAALAILYTWARADNHQIFVDVSSPPELVYSADHGHFLPPSGTWTREALDAEPDRPRLIDGCCRTVFGSKTAQTRSNGSAL